VDFDKKDYHVALVPCRRCWSVGQCIHVVVGVLGYLSEVVPERVQSCWSYIY
jgi:hypothetical protein